MNQPDVTPTDQPGPRHEGEVIFNARRHKRLRICIRSNNGEESYSRVTGLADPATQGTISSELSRAQAEMFDDEVFETLRSEAKNTPTLNTRSSTDQISVDAVPGQELVFEMVDTDDVYQDQINGTVKVSTHAKLLAALLRLGMLRIYRTRSQNEASTLSSQPSQKELLTPIVAYLHYQAFCRQLYEILNGFQDTMKHAGMSFEISKNTGGVSGGLDWEAFLSDDTSSTLNGRRQTNLKGNVEVLFQQRQVLPPFCTILVTADAHLTIVFSQTMFHSQDIAQLPVFLGQQLRSQVLSLLVDNLKALPEPVRYHVDEIAGVIKTRPTKLDVGLTLDDPPRLVAQSSRILPVGEGIESAFIASDERIVKERYTETTGVPFVAWAMERLL
ncbi:hypothetical protein QFC21_004701 [Naganishia friedmannii]|uniref:Uncharacterized protein n=1 Tax=Naganishia friedmannii TaxID=89922 RepID=A0ACC2VFA3_9TREE|nr:hypothetical protein QFC21_004701 [Naganishia friedmannii]